MDISVPTRPAALATSIPVALLMEEALGSPPDLAALRVTLAAHPFPVRALVRITDQSGLAFAAKLAATGVTAQLLLASTVSIPEDGSAATSMPPGSDAKELDDFALALSDVVIAVPGAEELAPVRYLLARAKGLGKMVCPPGCALGCITPPFNSVTRRLDPAVPGWHAKGRGWFGRMEQGFLESLAFGWRGAGENGGAHSRARLHDCMSRSWAIKNYSAPDPQWDVSPDLAATAPASPLRRKFEALDRSALYGSYIHRDSILLSHLLAAVAVLCAVVAVLFKPGSAAGLFCTATELVLLLFIAALIVSVRHARLHERWTACRLGAEQLRIALLCLPLLVVPPVLATAEGLTEGQDDLTCLAVAEVQRAVRDQGLPRLRPANGPREASEWLRLIVRDQIAYHMNNQRKLAHAEWGLRNVVLLFFVASVAGVVTHFFVHAQWLLLLTAAGPAFAAALHGTETQLGIVHRAGLSQEVHRDLTRVNKIIDAFITDPPGSVEAGWAQIRALALSAAVAMGQENKSWHRLLRRERDDLPA